MMCDYYPTCDHDEQPTCPECSKPMTLDGHGETTMASLDGNICAYCHPDMGRD